MIATVNSMAFFQAVSAILSRLECSNYLWCSAQMNWTHPLNMPAYAHVYLYVGIFTWGHIAIRLTLL